MNNDLPFIDKKHNKWCNNDLTKEANLSAELKQAPDELVIPEGVVITQTYGKITGQPLFKVDGFEMPLMSSPAEALRVYSSLKQAYESGYFNGSTVKKGGAASANTASPVVHDSGQKAQHEPA